jgi:hypothetical protein
VRLPPRATLALALSVAALAPQAGIADAASAAPSPAHPRALLVFAPLGERALAAAGLSVGIVSATQGPYSTSQLLLDVTQGSRLAESAYTRAEPLLAATAVASGARVIGFQAALRRARDAPARLQPGLLAGALGGAAYVGARGVSDRDAPAAADPSGTIASYSRGRVSTLTARIGAALKRWRLVVADLPGGAEGAQDLHLLAARRAPGELLLVLQRVPDAEGGELLWGAAAGLGSRAGTLTSDTTRERGLFAAIDVLPTILGHLRVHTRSAWVVGARLRSEPGLDGRRLTATMARLRAIPARRLPALATLLGAWALLVLAAAAWQASYLGRARGLPARAPVNLAIRAGAVGILWAPLVSMASAALGPSAAVECALIALACPALGALSDRLLGWPRALIAPALLVPAALVLDALAHTQLLMRSLLGPDPVGGARFYGLGNELKAALAVLELGATATALHPARRGRTSVLAFAAVGAALAALEGAPALGAGAGGAALCCAGFGTAAALLVAAPGTRRRALAALLVPCAAPALLAAVAILAGGGAHGYGGLGHVGSLTDLRDLLVRRYRTAWQALADPAMACATVLAALAAAAALRARRRLLAPVAGDPAFAAAAAGGLAAGAVGALSEDSGPLLFVQAVVVLGALAAYVHARAPLPLTQAAAQPRRPPTAPAPHARTAAPTRDSGEPLPVAAATVAAATVAVLSGDGGA